VPAQQLCNERLLRRGRGAGGGGPVAERQSQSQVARAPAKQICSLMLQPIPLVRVYSPYFFKTVAAAATTLELQQQPWPPVSQAFEAACFALLGTPAKQMLARRFGKKGPPHLHVLLVDGMNLFKHSLTNQGDSEIRSTPKQMGSINLLYTPSQHSVV